MRERRHARGTTRGHAPEQSPFWTRSKKWITGIVAASATAVLTAWVTTLFAAAPSVVEDIVRGEGNQRTVKTASGPTLSVSVEQGNACNANGWVYPNPSSGAQMQIPPGEGRRIGGRTWDEDPQAFGAKPAGPVRLLLAASATQTRAVILTRIDVTLVNRTEPIEGTRVVPGGGCGDGVTYHSAGVNFDVPAPYWVPFKPEGMRADQLQFPYKVTPADPSVLLLQVAPGDCLCKWTATLHWIDGSEQGATRIDDHGRPFETTNAADLPAVSWDNGERSPVQ